jgi:hypothetical protein
MNFEPEMFIEKLQSLRMCISWIEDFLA